jgi:hypothetical protein
MCGVYLAYAIITNSGGVVRIFNRMSDERVLIKVRKGTVARDLRVY